MTTAIIIIALIAVIALWVMGLYNKLIARKNGVRNAFAAVDVQLKKRYDLIPNLVATVRQYMEHERGLLSEITALRSRAVQPGLAPQERMEIDNQMTQKLQQLNVQIENYPNLKANESFMSLQNTLGQVEQEIAMTRNFYNSSVTEYNTNIQQFPNVLLAGLLGFQPEAVLETAEAERSNVDVGAAFRNEPGQTGGAMSKGQAEDLTPPVFNKPPADPDVDDVDMLDESPRTTAEFETPADEVNYKRAPSEPDQSEIPPIEQPPIHHDSFVRHQGTTDELPTQGESVPGDDNPNPLR
jgi:LemA protein